MSAKRNIAIMCNPIAGNGKASKVTEQIVITLKQKQVAHSVFTFNWPKIWDQFTDAWIVGGDGTLNNFINQYPQIQLPLSIFKGGTGNDFHWLVYDDITLDQQIEKVLNGVPQLVDAGICNEKLFLNGVGIGFDGAVVRDLINKRKSKGKSAYYLAVIKNIFTYKEQQGNIQSRNKNSKFPAPAVPPQKEGESIFMISVANGKRYGGGFLVTPKADITDGLFDVNVVSKVSLLQRLKYLPVIEKGNHTKLQFVHYFQTHRVEITFNTKLPAHIDGEYYSAAKFEIQNLPNRFAFMR
ncbi:MAG: diacylglycerol kinase family protein [Chitinophagaceae bacterium]